MTTGELYRFIASQKLAVLGTTSAADTPECALVGIAVTPALEIIFDTVKSSRKYRNLSKRPSVAFVIGWDNEITLQYEGEAREPSGPDLERLQSIYFAKWPDCREHLKWPDVAYVTVRPAWIRYSDFNPGGTGICEMTF